MERGEVFRVIGVPGSRALAEALYAGIAGDPVLRPLFPGKSLRCAIEAFSAFLVQFLGGPAEHTQRRWWLSLRESHLRFRVGARERDAWMSHMTAALASVVADRAVRAELQGFFEESSMYLVNDAGAVPATHPFPLDDAVASIRAGDSERAIALTAKCDQGVLPGLLGLMLIGANPPLIEYALDEIRQDRLLLSARYGGRTLLHCAAGAGKTEVVSRLLELGADPNAPDAGGHAPLYSVSNECQAGGGDVVRALVRAGAKVNAADGVQKCTALHMAARRGNLSVGQALVECGADVSAVDR
jgi:hemoglobin